MGQAINPKAKVDFHSLRLGSIASILAESVTQMVKIITIAELWTF